MMHGTRTAGLLAMVMSILMAGHVLAADTPAVTAAKQAYGFAKWPGRAPHDYKKLARITRETLGKSLPARYALRPADQAATARATQDKAAEDRTLYVLRDTSRDGIDIFVALHHTTSPLQAQEVLVDTLANVSSPRPSPAGADRGLKVGDVSFVGHAENLSRITFCRNNVFVRLYSSDDSYSVEDLAKSLDQAILTASGQDPATRPAATSPATPAAKDPAP